MQNLSLTELSGYISGHAGVSPNSRAAAFDHIRTIVEGDPRAVAAEGMPAVITSLNHLVIEGRRPWTGRGIKLLCNIVCSDGAYLLDVAVRTSVAEALKSALQDDDAKVSSAAALILASPGLRSAHENASEVAVYLCILKSLMLPLPPKTPQHLHGAARALSRILLDPSAVHRAGQTIEYWLPYCVHALSFDTPCVLHTASSGLNKEETGEPLSQTLQGEYATAQRDIERLLTRVMCVIPVQMLPNGRQPAVIKVHGALKSRTGFLKECLEGKDPILIAKGLTLWAVQAHFDGTIRDKRCRHETEVNTLLTTMTNVLQNEHNVAAGLLAWKHLVASWTLHRTFFKKKYAAILAYPIVASRQRVWGQSALPASRLAACKVWVLLLTKTMRNNLTVRTEDPDEDESPTGLNVDHYTEIVNGFTDAILPEYTPSQPNTDPGTQRTKTFERSLRPEESCLTILLLLETLFNGKRRGGAMFNIFNKSEMRSNSLDSSFVNCFTATTPDKPGPGFLDTFARELGVGTDTDLPSNNVKKANDTEDTTLSLRDAATHGVAENKARLLFWDEASVLLSLLVQKREEAPQTKPLDTSERMDIDEINDNGKSSTEALPFASYLLQNFVIKHLDDYEDTFATLVNGGALQDGKEVEETRTSLLFLFASKLAQRAKDAVLYAESQVEDVGFNVIPASLILGVWLLSKLLLSTPLNDVLKAYRTGGREMTFLSPDTVSQQGHRVAAFVQDLSVLTATLPCLLNTGRLHKTQKPAQIRLTKVLIAFMSPFAPLLLDISPTDLSVTYGKQLFVNSVSALLSLSQPNCCVMDFVYMAVEGLMWAGGPKVTNKFQFLVYAFEHLSERVVNAKCATKEAGDAHNQVCFALWTALTERFVALLVGEEVLHRHVLKKQGGAAVAVSSLFCKKKHYEPLLSALVALPLQILSGFSKSFEEGTDDRTFFEHLSTLFCKRIFRNLGYLEALYLVVKHHQHGSPVTEDIHISGHGVLHQNGRISHTALHPIAAFAQSLLLCVDSFKNLHRTIQQALLSCTAEYVSTTKPLFTNLNDAFEKTEAAFCVAKRGFLCEEFAVREGLGYAATERCEELVGEHMPFFSEVDVETQRKRFLAQFDGEVLDENLAMFLATISQTGVSQVFTKQLGHIPVGFYNSDVESPIFKVNRTSNAFDGLLQFFFNFFDKNNVLVLDLSKKVVSLLNEITQEGVSQEISLGFDRAVCDRTDIAQLLRYQGEVLDVLQVAKHCLVGRYQGGANQRGPLGGRLVQAPQWGMAALNNVVSTDSSASQLLASLTHPAGPIPTGLLESPKDAAFLHLLISASSAYFIIPKLTSILKASKQYLLLPLSEDETTEESRSAEGEIRCKAVQDSVSDVLRDVCVLLEENGTLNGLIGAVQGGGGEKNSTAGKVQILPLERCSPTDFQNALQDSPGETRRHAVHIKLITFLISHIVETLLKSGVLHLAGYAMRLWERSIGRLSDSEARSLGLIYTKGLSDALYAASKAAGKTIRLPGSITAEEKRENNEVTPTLERPMSPTLCLPCDSQTVLAGTPPEPTGAAFRTAFGSSVKKQPQQQSVTLPPPSPRAKKELFVDSQDPPVEKKKRVREEDSTKENPKKRQKQSTTPTPQKSGNGTHFFPDLIGCNDPVYALAECGDGGGAIPQKMWAASSGCPVDVATVGDLAGLTPQRAQRVLRNVAVAQRLLVKHHANLEHQRSLRNQSALAAAEHRDVFSVPIDDNTEHSTSPPDAQTPGEEKPPPSVMVGRQRRRRKRYEEGEEEEAKKLENSQSSDHMMDEAAEMLNAPEPIVASVQNVVQQEWSGLAWLENAKRGLQKELASANTTEDNRMRLYAKMCAEMATVLMGGGGGAGGGGGGGVDVQGASTSGAGTGVALVAALPLPPPAPRTDRLRSIGADSIPLLENSQVGQTVRGGGGGGGGSSSVQDTMNPNSVVPFAPLPSLMPSSG